MSRLKLYNVDPRFNVGYQVQLLFEWLCWYSPYALAVVNAAFLYGPFCYNRIIDFTKLQITLPVRT